MTKFKEGLKCLVLNKYRTSNSSARKMSHGLVLKPYNSYTERIHRTVQVKAKTQKESINKPTDAIVVINVYYKTNLSEGISMYGGLFS